MNEPYPHSPRWRFLGQNRSRSFGGLDAAQYGAGIALDDYVLSRLIDTTLEVADFKFSTSHRSHEHNGNPSHTRRPSHESTSPPFDWLVVPQASRFTA